MALFVINEWLWEDLRSENGRLKQQQAVSFLEQFSKSNHQIIVVSGSRFDQKAWGLCKHNNSIIQSIGKYFVTTIRYDSNLCRIIEPSDIPDLTEVLVQGINPDDYYLAQALLAYPEAILVTTDTKLRDFLRGQKFNCITREEFLDQYFSL